MTTDNNWPDKLCAITRNWGKTDTAGRFMGFSNVDVLHSMDVRKGQITIEYIRADIVEAREKEALDAAIGIVTAVNTERELAAIRATLEAVKVEMCIYLSDKDRDSNPTALEASKLILDIDPQEILNSLEK